MKNKLILTVLILFVAAGIGSAQEKDKTDKEDRKEDRQEKTAEKMAKVRDKTDYHLFHRQMLSLKEFSEERRKIPALHKANKVVVKVVAVIDSAEGDEDSKTLIGYIRQDIGDNSINLYDITFDRTQKKIVSVKRTAEATEAEKEEQAEPATKIKPKSIHKKKKDDDDDDDGDDDNSSKNKDKDED